MSSRPIGPRMFGYRLMLKERDENDPPASLAYVLWSVFVLSCGAYFFWEKYWGSGEEKRWVIVVGIIHPAISLSIFLYERLVWLYRKHVLKGELAFTSTGMP